MNILFVKKHFTALCTVIFLSPIFCCAFFLTRQPELADFGEVKRLLENKVWFDHPVTVYCQASYDKNKNIIFPAGFTTRKQRERAGRMEWEHAVPAENFGRTFREWREGDPACVRRGRPYKGRKCAEKTNAEYRQMESDMYNLFPSIGAVNAVRANREYAELPYTDSGFGSCNARYEGRYFEPPDDAKGQVARASLYMAWKYPRFRLSKKQEKLYRAWDKMFPVDTWECKRARRIEKLQGNENIFIKEGCRKAGL